MRKLEPLFAHLEEMIRRQGGPGDGIAPRPRDEAAEPKKPPVRGVDRVPGWADRAARAVPAAA